MMIVMTAMMRMKQLRSSSAAAVTKGVGQIASREGGGCQPLHWLDVEGWGEDGWAPACFLANLLLRRIENKSHSYWDWNVEVHEKCICLEIYFFPQTRIIIIFSSSLIESWSLSSSHHQLGELDTWGLIPLFQTQSIHHQSSSPVSRGLNCQWILRNCVLCYTSLHSRSSVEQRTQVLLQSEPKDKVHQDRIQMWTKLEYKSAPKVYKSERRVHHRESNFHKWAAH